MTWIEFSDNLEASVVDGSVEVVQVPYVGGCWGWNPGSKSHFLGGGLRYVLFHPYLGKISIVTIVLFKWVEAAN